MLIARARSLNLIRRSLVTTFIAPLVMAAVPAASAAEVAEDPALMGGYSFKRSEVCLMKKINRARRSRGYSGLSWDKQMGYVARRHAQAMAGQRSVYHDYSVGQKVTRWRRLGQNSGRSGRCKGMFRSFLRSSSHRANIFGKWRHVGVGTDRAGDKLYVQQIFESRRNPGNIYSYP